MQSATMFTLLALAMVPLCADAARLRDTPASRVVTLITDLQSRIEADGKKEQEEYDKFACWVEETLERKSGKISKAKETISSLETKMKELEGEIASHGGEITQLKKDIAENVEAQREANEMRAKGSSEYAAEKTESEQCIGALEAAIKVLSGAGTGKEGLLETMREAELLSVVAGVRRAIGSPRTTDRISGPDLALVRHFLSSPEDFVAGRVGGMSAAQIANNPFGDYAPQSTQIQGILKGMYDTFATDLEKANAEEADQQKSHEELMDTKEKELQTLQATLEKQTLDKASKNDELAKSKRLRDDTQKQLEADEVFFEDTKAAGKVKATEWSERTRLRTEELQGIATAIRILDSPEAQAAFAESGTTFMQLSKRTASNKIRAKAYALLRDLATGSSRVQLARIAATLKTGGHFDKVIASIDKMIALLRKEEQEDIEHKDRCENSQRKNSQDAEDVASAISKSKAEIKQMGEEVGKLGNRITDLETDIKETKDNMAEALKQRNDESDEFKKALKTDTDAAALLQKAIVAIAKFYRDNKISLGLAQKGNDEPEYSEDKDKAPETSWSGADYGGRKSESQGIIAILKMLQEDVEREMTVARREEKDAQKAYEKSKAEFQSMLDTQEASKVASEQDLAELEGAKSTEEAALEDSNNDADAQADLKNSLKTDCDWVATHFDTRREKRKAEIDGLVGAKDMLAGVESGDDSI